VPCTAPEREEGPGHTETRGEESLGARPLSGQQATEDRDCSQLLFVEVSATVAGVAACTVVAVVAAVVLAVVETVVLAAVASAVEAAVAVVDADESVAVPAAMQPVRTAAVAKPATAVTRRAPRAGCGRRLRVMR
jgi:hypothetical protein